MAELRTLQADRKAAIEQALEEVDLHCQLAESHDGYPEPSQFTSLTRFDFSDVDISRVLLRMRNLREARKQFQSPRKPSKLAA